MAELPAILKRLRSERGMTQQELATESGFSVSVISQAEAGKRQFAIKTARAVLETFARRIPLLEADAHDFLVASGIMQDAGGHIGAAMHAEFTRKGLLRESAHVPAAASTIMPEPIASLCARALEALGADRFTIMLQTMLAMSATAPQTVAVAAPAPRELRVVHPPVQKAGYTEQVVKTYERASPPGGASRSSHKPGPGAAAGE